MPVEHTPVSKPWWKSKTIGALVGTAAAYYIPLLAAGAPVIDNSTTIGTVHGVAIPLGLLVAGVARLTGKHVLR